jgi:hypothetical protein
MLAGPRFHGSKKGECECRAPPLHEFPRDSTLSTELASTCIWRNLKFRHPRPLTAGKLDAAKRSNGLIQDDIRKQREIARSG